MAGWPKVENSPWKIKDRSGQAQQGRSSLLHALAGRRFNRRPACLLLVLALLAAGCAPFGTPAPAATLTATAPAPTLTATASPLPPTPTALSRRPTQTPAPAATPTRTPGPLAFTRQGDNLPPRPGPAALPPTPHGATFSIPCTVNAASLNLREGPGSGYNSLDILPSAAVVSALKCTPGASWLLVETPQSDIGWVNAAFLNCQGDISLLPVAQGVIAQGPPPPPAAAPPTATPAASPLPPPPGDAWRGEYFDNPNLAGQPVLVRNDPNLDFNWYTDSPGPNLPGDNFSVRWTRLFQLETGDYRFLAVADDGVKVYLDGWLVIDQWRETVPVTHIGEFAGVQAGPHTITVEFFEAGGLAHLKFWFEKTVLVENAWVGEYFNNRNWEGQPVMVRADEDIDFDWNDDAPASGMDDDHFSVRWRRSIFFKAGDYRFTAKIDNEDKVRILLDGWLVVDRYREDSGEVTGKFDRLGEGYHTVIVEFQESGDDAGIEVDWERDD